MRGPWCRSASGTPACRVDLGGQRLGLGMQCGMRWQRGPTAHGLRVASVGAAVDLDAQRLKRGLAIGHCRGQVAHTQG
jgi:hypothetical protein